jgi:hypothetical protein
MISLGGESNPYRAPEAEIVAPYTGPRFRVRMIPAVFCYFVGIMGLFAFLVYSLIMGVTAYRILKADPNSLMSSVFSPKPRNLGALVLWLCVGVNGLIGARSWMMGKWRLAIFSSIKTCAFMVVNYVLDPFR